MKKWMILMLATALLLGAAACREKTETPEENGTPASSAASLASQPEGQSEAPLYEMREETVSCPVEDGALVYFKSTVSYPFFFGDSKGESILNHRYESMIAELQAGVEEHQQQYEDAKDWLEVDSLPYYQDVTSRVMLMDRGIISVKDDITMFMGGTHPYHYIIGQNYVAQTGEELDDFTDVLVGSQEQIDAALSYYMGADLWKQYCDGTAYVEAYHFTQTGMTLYLHLGDALPKEEVTVPFTHATDYKIDAARLTAQIG